MIRAYRFLLRPTFRQTQALTAMLNDHREIYNAALQERRDAYRMVKVPIRYGEQSAQLKDIRSLDPDQARWSFSSQQTTLRRLDRAFAEFFRRVKAPRAGRRPGYPRFKGARALNTVVWPVDGDGCRWLPDTNRIRLQGIGHVRAHQHRSVIGRVKTISVKREGHRWYVILSCGDVPMAPLDRTGVMTGIDLGIASFLTTSEGEHVPNPRCLRASARKLTEAQRGLSGCKRTSHRRQKARVAVAMIHRKIARQRLDHAHKVALSLVRRCDVICHEALRIVDMSRSAHGTVAKPGTNVSQKAGLNRSILDAGWGCFLSILTAKAESAGRSVIAVNPRNTSRTCPTCGHCCAENRATQADFRCVSCGYAAHADVVGAVNVLRAGLVLHIAKAA